MPDCMFRSIRDTDITLPGYPMRSTFQEIGSLIYINLICGPRGFLQEADLGQHVLEDNIIMMETISSRPPWVWFRNLKSLVIKGKVDVAVEEYFARREKDATTEITREVEQIFQKLKEKDPSRSLPKITVEAKFMRSRFLTGFYLEEGGSFQRQENGYGFFRNTTKSTR